VLVGALAVLVLLLLIWRLPHSINPTRRPAAQVAGLPCSHQLVQALGLDAAAASRAEKVGPCLPQSLTLTGEITGTITEALVVSCSASTVNRLPNAVFRVAVADRPFTMTFHFPTLLEESAAPTPPKGAMHFPPLVMESGTDRWVTTGGNILGNSREGKPIDGQMDFYLSRDPAGGLDVHIKGTYRCGLGQTSPVGLAHSVGNKIMPGPYPASARWEVGSKAVDAESPWSGGVG
jgi:hypothetical protein